MRFDLRRLCLCLAAIGASIGACTVDSGFLDGRPCGPDGVCATGYSCVREPCGEGYLCAVCRSNSDLQDAGLDAGPDGDGPVDGGDRPGDQPAGCQQSPPACKSLPDCLDVAPDCVDGIWVCQTGYEQPERSCDFVDNDCDGQTDVGLVCRLAGGFEPGLADGTADQARFDRPRSILALPSGDLLVSDSGNHAIRQIGLGGTTITLAGNGLGGYQDGLGDQARFREPAGLALNTDGTVVVADRLNHRIRQLDAAGNVITLAGSGFVAYKDGPVDQAQFAFPSSVAVASDGSIYVADAGNHCIRKIAAGQVTTFAGRCGFPGLADGDPASARFNSPTDLLFAADGQLLVTEESSHRVRQVTPDGTVGSLAGDGQYGWQDGPLANARFANPAGLAQDPNSDKVLVADSSNHRVRSITAQVTTLAGSGVAGSADGPPALAEFNRPSGVAFLPSGRVVVADTNNHTLRVFTP
jgi:hypothetical protein